MMDQPPPLEGFEARVMEEVWRQGSVTVRGDLLRINIALIDTRSRMQVWSGRYERAITNRYGIQDEIVASLGRELQIEIISAESAVAGSNPDVHELIFKGFEAIDAANRRG